MPIDLERTLTLADIINKGAVSLAVVCAGSFALYKYVIQESPAAQLANDQLKRACAERGSLDIKLGTKHAGDMILGTVSLRNIGTSKVDLDLDQHPPITITELTFASDGKPRASRSIEVSFPYVRGGDLIEWNKPSLLPGRTMELNFAAAVGHPGTYLLSFRGGGRHIFPDNDACSISIQEKLAAAPWFWAATAIQQVPEAADATRRVLHEVQK